MNLELDLDFAERFSPERFFFGVANAPYLCEGGYNTPGGPKNSYGYFEAAGTVPVSGETTRFFHDFERHIALAASLGLNAFRTGIDWARVQPTTRLAAGEPPAWDDSAVERYAEIVACISAHGMEPIVTLHHFTHPAWIGPSLVHDPEAMALLADFEVRVVAEVNHALVKRGVAPMRHFLTFNELNLVPLLYHVQPHADVEGMPRGLELVGPGYDNMAVCHIEVYDRLKDLFSERGWSEPRVGFGTASMCPYEIDKLPLDLVRLRQHGVRREEAARAIERRRASWNERVSRLARAKLTDDEVAAYETFCEVMESTVPMAGFERTLDAIYASPRAAKLDYLSANIYEPFMVPRSQFGVRPMPKWWDNAADADIYRAFIHAYHDHNEDRVPVYMGENTLAYRKPVDGPAETRPDGCTRERYLIKAYLMEMIGAMRDGVPIEGYLYWSIVDDFEWEEGFEPRLGLFHYDYATHTIDETDALGEPAGEAYAQLVSALRTGDKGRIRDTFVNSLR